MWLTHDAPSRNHYGTNVSHLAHGKIFFQATARGDAVNDFDDWNQAEILVKHLLMTQPGLIFATASTRDGKTVGSTTLTVAANRELSECPGTIGLANRSS